MTFAQIPGQYFPSDAPFYAAALSTVSLSLCLTVDRLNADFLGAYGNTWIETPAFDALAAESVLFDSFYATSLDLATLFRAFWRGESPREIVDELREEDEPTAPCSLFRALKEQGYRAYVVSDAREIAVHPAVEGDFCDGRFFLGEPDAAEPAAALDETKFYHRTPEQSRLTFRPTRWAVPTAARART